MRCMTSNRICRGSAFKYGKFSQPLLYRTALSVPKVPTPHAVTHTSFTQQCSQSGFVLALHTALPWYTRRWQKSLPSSGGTNFQRAISTFFGSLMLSTNPIRFTRRIQWVSVTMAGFPNTSPMIRLALFLPTPGSFKRALKSSGTFPL